MAAGEAQGSKEPLLSRIGTELLHAVKSNNSVHNHNAQGWIGTTLRIEAMSASQNSICAFAGKDGLEQSHFRMGWHTLFHKTLA